MVELATVTAAISATTAAAGLFDKIADQVQRFITKKPEPDMLREHRMRIEESDGNIVPHGGFGEGDGETRLSKGRKVRPAPTLRGGRDGGNAALLPDYVAASRRMNP
jgi:hypothetical protein